MGNDVDMSEMAEICGKCQILDTRLKYVGNDLEIWEMAKIFRKWLRYIGHGLSMLHMT